MLLSLAVSAGCLISGYWFFRKAESRFADVI
jgi:ABC-type polysaccharide/polyol phosphate export permease